MKKLWGILALTALLIPSMGRGVVVHNSGTDGADSISLPFYALDSGGYNMVALAANDSVFLQVFYPDNGLAFEDSIVYNGTGVTAEGASSFSTYTLAKAVADIDGTATDGVYTWMLVVKDASLGLPTPHAGQFNLLTAGDYEDIFDSATMAADNNAEVLNIDAWNPITDNDSLIVDRSTSKVNVASVDNNAIDLANDVTGVLADANVASIQVNVESMSAGTITSTQLGTACITSDELGATAVDEIWDEDSTGHNTAGSFGQIIEDLLDSINVLETWIAQEGSLFDPANDSVIADGSALAATSGAIAAATIATDAIGSAEVADDIVGRFADTVWQNDSASMYAGGNGSVGDVVRDSAYGGAAGDISDADMIAIVDTLMTRTVADDTTDGGGVPVNVADHLKLNDSALWASIAGVADGVWDEVLSGHTDAGSAGDIIVDSIDAKVSAAGGGGLDSIAVYGALEQLIADSSVARTGAGVVWQLRGLYVTAGGTDSTAVQFTGNGAGEALQLTAGTTGNALEIDATTGDGINIDVATAGYGIYARGNQSGSGGGLYVTNANTGGSGHAVTFEANGSGGYGFGLVGQGGGHGLAVVTFGSGDGFNIASASGNDIELAGDGEIKGTIIPADTLLGGELVAFMPNDFTAADSAGYQGSGGGSDTVAIKAAATNNPDLFYGPSVTTPTDTTESGYAVSSQGFGPDTLVLYFNDTSGTDTPIGDVFFSIQNSAGTNVMAFASETATGKRTVHLTDGSYTVVPRKTGYIFDSYALTASGNDDSVEVAGYDRVVGTSGASSVCRMYGYVTDVGADWFKNVSITASLPSDTYDSCANTIVFERTKGTRSNDTGYFYIDLIYSSCLSDEKYQFTFEKKNYESITKDITVPDSTTCYIRWED